MALLFTIAQFSSALAAQKELVFGMSAAFTGANAELGIEFYRGAMAWFTHVNSQGGVNGRKLVLRTANDGYNPLPCFRNTVNFIHDDDIFALFSYVGTPTTTKILPLLELFEERNVTMLCPITGAQPLREPPYDKYVYNLRASYRQETARIVDRLIQSHRERIAVFYQADAYGRSGWDGIRRALARYDLQIEAEASYRRGATYEESYRPQIDITCATNPDAIICIGTYASCAGFVRDARNYGYKGVIVSVSFANSDKVLSLLKQEQGNGVNNYLSNLLFSQVVPSPENTAYPAVREYRKLMLLYHERETTGVHRFSYASFEGFLNAKLVTEAVRRMGDTPDKTRLGTIMKTLNDYDLGIGVPLRFSESSHQGLHAIYFSTVKDGKQQSAIDWDRWQK